MDIFSRLLTTIGVMRSKGRIYMDNAATTEIDPQAKEAVFDCMAECWGNPSAPYREGKQAKHALEWSREIFSKGLNVPAINIIFTSCGTESNNIAIRCVMNKKKLLGKDILITSAVEHSSVRKTAAHCGCQNIEIRVDAKGRVLIKDFEDILNKHKDKIGMISIILAQNEIGVIQDIPKLVEISRKIVGPDIIFHTDATQAIGKMPIDIEKLGVDLMTGSAHKFHGPRGVGILYSRSGVLDDESTPMSGGGQEGGIRSGTENVPAIVGAAMAFAIANEPVNLSRNIKKMQDMKFFICSALRDNIPGIIFNCDFEEGLSNIINFCISTEIHGHDMVEYMDENGVSLNSGSACSRSKQPSTTLMAMGLSDLLAHCAIRISLSKQNNMSECVRVVRLIVKYVNSKKSV